MLLSLSVQGLNLGFGTRWASILPLSALRLAPALYTAQADPELMILLSQPPEEKNVDRHGPPYVVSE